MGQIRHSGTVSFTGPLLSHTQCHLGPHPGTDPRPSVYRQPFDPRTLQGPRVWFGLESLRVGERLDPGVLGPGHGRSGRRRGPESGSGVVRGLLRPFVSVGVGGLGRVETHPPEPPVHGKQDRGRRATLPRECPSVRDAKRRDFRVPPRTGVSPSPKTSKNLTGCSQGSPLNQKRSGSTSRTSAEDGQPRRDAPRA